MQAPPEVHRYAICWWLTWFRDHRRAHAHQTVLAPESGTTCYFSGQCDEHLLWMPPIEIALAVLWCIPPSRCAQLHNELGLLLSQLVMTCCFIDAIQKAQYSLYLSFKQIAKLAKGTCSKKKKRRRKKHTV